MSARVPDGLTVRLVDDAVVLEGGSVLLGGSPLTSLRIADPARRIRGRHVTVADQASAWIADRLLATNLALPDLAAAPTPPLSDLTVVIPVRDRPEELDRCLAGLAGLKSLVIDDASLNPARVADVVRRHGATVITLEKNVGPAAARNIGLARVETPYVAFVDSDVQVDSHSLQALLRHFVDPSVVLAGPRVVGTTRRARPRWFERYETRDSSLTLGKRSGSVRLGAGVAWLPSACLVGRTRCLGDGFDAQMRVGEDVDLVWRLTAAGHRVRYDADVEARHDTRPTVRAWLARKAFYGSGSAALASRHGDRVAPAVLTPTFAVAAAALLGRRWVALPLTVVALVRGHRAVSAVLPSGPAASHAAARITVRGLGWAIRQESALLLRHWWPATLAIALFSRRARTAVVTALAVDVAVVIREAEGLPLADLPWHLAARRLDDLAYGAGLWWGTMRHAHPGALKPRWIRRDVAARSGPGKVPGKSRETAGSGRS